MVNTCTFLSTLLSNGSLPGSSVHRILQARTLEQVAMPASRGPSRPRGPPCLSDVSCPGRPVLTTSTTQKAPEPKAALKILSVKTKKQTKSREGIIHGLETQNPVGVTVPALLFLLKSVSASLFLLKDEHFMCHSDLNPSNPFSILALSQTALHLYLNNNN